MWHRKTPEFPFESWAKEPFKWFLSCVGQRTIAPVSQHYWCHIISVLLVTTLPLRSPRQSNTNTASPRCRMESDLRFTLNAVHCLFEIIQQEVVRSRRPVNASWTLHPAEQSGCETGQSPNLLGRGSRGGRGAEQPAVSIQSDTVEILCLWKMLSKSWRKKNRHHQDLKQASRDLFAYSPSKCIWLMVETLHQWPMCWKNRKAKKVIVSIFGRLCNVSIMQNAPLNSFIISWKHPVVILLWLNKGIIPIRGYVLTRGALRKKEKATRALDTQQ